MEVLEKTPSVDYLKTLEELLSYSFRSFLVLEKKKRTGIVVDCLHVYVSRLQKK